MPPFDKDYPYGVRIRISGQWLSIARFTNQRNAEYFCNSIREHSQYQMYCMAEGGPIEFVENHLNYKELS